MSPVIILGLVLMWAVVLIPMWLRRHDEVEESRSVDRFSAAMHTLSRHEQRSAQRNVRVPARPSVLDVHVSGASAPEARAARRRKSQAARRGQVFVLMLVGCVAMFAGAILHGSALLWTAQVLLDVLVVAYVTHLRRMAVLAHASRRRAVSRRRDNALLDELERDAELGGRAAAAPQRVDAAPQWEEGITVFRAGSDSAHQAAPLAASGDEVFDQTALADEPEIEAWLAADFDDALAVAAPTQPRAAAGDGFFDQETDLSVAVPPRRSFVETGAVPSRAAEVAQRAERAARAAAAAAAAAAEAEAVGGKPWEPIPVPRPTYAMKPAAPVSRPARPRHDEPLLPPVDRQVELEADDDLEAILDRRWAVND